MQRTRVGLILCGLLVSLAARADGALHSLWELHGKHNTVYLLGSIHVLRPRDYPLAPALLDAYGDAKSVLMEVNMEEIGSAEVQSEMLGSAMLPEGKTLTGILGQQRYARALLKLWDLAAQKERRGDLLVRSIRALVRR